MSSWATVRTISPAKNGIGIVPPPHECCIPPGCVVVEYKYCEMCGRPFTKELATRLRLCDGCKYKPYDPKDLAAELKQKQDEYLEQLPNLDIIHASARPIRYPVPVPVGRETSSHLVSRKTPRRMYKREYAKWPAVVRTLLASKPCTLEELCDVIPNATSPRDACNRLIMAHIPYKRVGDAPRRVKKGPAPGLFMLDETIY